MDMRAGMNILCTIRVSKNYSKNKHKTQSNQRHRFTLQIPKLWFSKKKKIPETQPQQTLPKTQILFSSSWTQPDKPKTQWHIVNVNPWDSWRWWRRRWILLFFSLSLCFFLPLLDLRFFLCIHVVYNLFNLLSLFWLFCLGCPMWFTFQCIRDFSCNRQNIFLQNPIPAP